jgi:hypothetical protein
MAKCCDNQRIPNTVSAGLSFTANVADADHPVPAWEYVLYLRGPKTIDLTADATGVITADTSVTANWLAGQYWYSLRAISGTNVAELETGSLTVEPNFLALPEGYDGRSQDEIALEAIDSVIAKRATLDQQRYTINNRELWRFPIGDLLKLRSVLSARVARERRRKCGAASFGRPVYVRFHS